MFPLKERQTIGYGFGDPTFYSAHHLGQDYEANYAELFAPFSGQIVWEGYGSQGGNTIHFKPDGQDVVIRFMHLSEFKRGQEYVSEGELIAITGNTGSATSGAHLHIDISQGSVQINNFTNFLDPEQFNWGQGENMGFSDSHMRGVIESAFRQTRLNGMGKVDEAGLKSDVDYFLNEVKGGSTNIGKQIDVYFKAPDFIWVKKSDVVSQVAKAVADATKPKDEIIALMQSDYQKEKDRLQAVIDDLTEKLKQAPTWTTHEEKVVIESLVWNFIKSLCRRCK